MIGSSACWRGSVTAPSCERIVLLLRSTLAIEPRPVAVGAALAIDADVAEQTRPTSRIELTSTGRLGVAQAFALVSVGVAALAFDSCWSVATGVTCPAPVALANGSDVTLAADVPRVSALPATERFNAVAVADPAKTSGESAAAGPATTKPARRQAAAPAPTRLIRFTCIPSALPATPPRRHLARSIDAAAAASSGTTQSSAARDANPAHCCKERREVPFLTIFPLAIQLFSEGSGRDQRDIGDERADQRNIGGVVEGDGGTDIAVLMHDRHVETGGIERRRCQCRPPLVPSGATGGRRRPRRLARGVGDGDLPGGDDGDLHNAEQQQRDQREQQRQ